MNPTPAPTPVPTQLPTTTLLALVLYALVLLTLMAGAWIWLFVRKLMGEKALPLPKPQRAPWSLGSVLLVMLAYLGCQILVGVVYRMVVPRPAPDAPADPRDLLAVTTLSNLLLVPVVLILLRLTSGTRLGHFGLGWSPIGRDVALGFWGCFLLAPLIYMLNISIVVVNLLVFKFKPEPHPVFTMVRDRGAVMMVIFALLTAVVVAPLVEELLFRGVLLGWMTKWFSRFDRASESGTIHLGLGNTLPGSAAAAPLVDPEAPTQWIPPEELEPGIEVSPSAPFSGTGSPGAGAEAVPPSAADLPWPAHALDRTEPIPDTFDTGDLLPPSGTGFESDSKFASAAFAPSARARWTANLLVSLIFAGLHFPQWPAPISLFFLSLGLGMLAQRTGGLVAPIVMHASFNAISTIGLAILVLTGGLQNIPDPFQGLK